MIDIFVLHGADGKSERGIHALNGLSDNYHAFAVCFLGFILADLTRLI